MSPSNVASPRANRKPTRPRLPRYVNVFTDRHGKQRSYFRHAGNRTPLRSELGSPEWWREYSDALAGRTVARPGLPVTPRVSAGSVASVIAGVVASAKYQKLRRTSRRSYQRSFQILRDLAGDMLIRKMKREHFVKIVDAQQRVSIGAGNEMLKVCRVVGRHARLLGLIEHDPVADLHKQGPKQRGGHHTWLPEEAAQFRKHHPPGSLARLVFELAHETGLRRGDLCRVGWEHMAEGKIRIVPTKTSGTTGATAVIKITDELRVALDLIRDRRIVDFNQRKKPFVVGADGRPITPDHLGWLFAGWCREADLPDRCRLHGLRKSLGSRLATAGADIWEIGATLADEDVKSLQVYTAGRDKDALAERAFTRLNRTRAEN
jgi:integrase